MGLIHLLSEKVSNQIAAGEVIQRPASAVKELMENAVDAGASRIDVRLVDAGRTLIHVLDNGVGMVEADAKRCFDRHATSKLRTFDELQDGLPTFGYRGQALHALAVTSLVEIVSRCTGAPASATNPKYWLDSGATACACS